MPRSDDNWVVEISTKCLGVVMPSAGLYAELGWFFFSKRGS
jgi:hypothetical protein